jgi:hypothetical protein
VFHRSGTTLYALSKRRELGLAVAQLPVGVLLVTFDRCGWDLRMWRVAHTQPSSCGQGGRGGMAAGQLPDGQEGPPVSRAHPTCSNHPLPLTCRATPPPDAIARLEPCLEGLRA